MHIRRGLTRTVIVTKNHAIKIPRLSSGGNGFTGTLWGFARGILANQGEADWWTWAQQTGDHVHLCPVLRSWLGGIINVYPRAEPYDPGPEIRMAMFERRYFPVEMTPIPSDNKPDNYGYVNGTLVIIDYDMTFNGCPHDRSGARNRIAQDREDSIIVT